MAVTSWGRAQTNPLATLPTPGHLSGCVRSCAVWRDLRTRAPCHLLPTTWDPRVRHSPPSRAVCPPTWPHCWGELGGAQALPSCTFSASRLGNHGA